MQLSAEVLDHIFSFLVSHWEILIPCSNDPVLSPIVERHLYYHVIVHIGKGADDFIHTFEPDLLSRLISKNPRILNYVRKLQIQVEFYQSAWHTRLDHFSKTLVMFPNLECIILTNPPGLIEVHWKWSNIFRAALEDRLSLLTLTELHLVGSEDFPFSLLDHCQNIKYLSLSGDFTLANVQVCDSQTLLLPQLRSLTFRFENGISSSLLAWIILHINQLQSMKSIMLTTDKVLLSELLGVCSSTLRKLDVDMTHVCEVLSPLDDPKSLAWKYPKLQQLTIRAFAEWYVDEDGSLEWCTSLLPVAAEAINSFIPSLQHLILDIDIRLSVQFDLTIIDFSPLSILGVAALSIPRIDLYIHTEVLPSAVTQAQLLTSLRGYDGIVKSIKEGVLVIHPEEEAPDG